MASKILSFCQSMVTSQNWSSVMPTRKLNTVEEVSLWISYGQLATGLLTEIRQWDPSSQDVSDVVTCAVQLGNRKWPVSQTHASSQDHRIHTVELIGLLNREEGRLRGTESYLRAWPVVRSTSKYHTPWKQIHSCKHWGASSVAEDL